ncbi:hypothetical protein NDU88_008239 [Pleurodeles waltl]|uniref:Uncharacterized protein n=1 Tax=Pleurodeles waltl TaxID=8319 RepID=A0AAV7U3G4_PLEWA|nr:hypothetical protein NDU88_008239 [Pleurodeles waltl]
MSQTAGTGGPLAVCIATDCWQLAGGLGTHLSLQWHILLGAGWRTGDPPQSALPQTAGSWGPTSVCSATDCWELAGRLGAVPQTAGSWLEEWGPTSVCSGTDCWELGTHLSLQCHRLLGACWKTGCSATDCWELAGGLGTHLSLQWHRLLGVGDPPQSAVPQTAGSLLEDWVQCHRLLGAGWRTGDPPQSAVAQTAGSWGPTSVCSATDCWELAGRLGAVPQTAGSWLEDWVQCHRLLGACWKTGCSATDCWELARGLCAVPQTTGSWLEDWVQYHRLLGDGWRTVDPPHSAVPQTAGSWGLISVCGATDCWELAGGLGTHLSLQCRRLLGDGDPPQSAVPQTAGRWLDD